jgi:hypothetical protein
LGFQADHRPARRLRDQILNNAKQIFIIFRHFTQRCLVSNPPATILELTRGNMAESSKTNAMHDTASAVPTSLRRDGTPTIFADGLLGGSIEAGVVRLELLARHLDPDTKTLAPALVGRLALPAENFTAFVAALVDLAKKTQAAPRS